MRRTICLGLSTLALCAWFAAPAGAAGKKSQALEELKPQLLEETQALQKSIQTDDVPAALESVQLIDAWLRQVQAQDVQAVFLDVAGWEKELGESQSMSGMVFGGGITASCTYRKGDETVEINIVGNSPMVGMISGMMGMAVASGKKVVRIQGNKALVDDSGGRVELQVPFQGNTLVTSKGPNQESTVHVTEHGVGWDALAAAVQN